jgi:protein TonB
MGAVLAIGCGPQARPPQVAPQPPQQVVEPMDPDVSSPPDAMPDASEPLPAVPLEPIEPIEKGPTPQPRSPPQARAPQPIERPISSPPPKPTDVASPQKRPPQKRPPQTRYEPVGPIQPDERPPLLGPFDRDR